MVNAKLLSLYPRERYCIHFVGGWLDPKAGVYECGKSLSNWDSIPGPSSPLRVATPTALVIRSMFTSLFNCCDSGVENFNTGLLRVFLA